MRARERKNIRKELLPSHACMLCYEVHELVIDGDVIELGKHPDENNKEIEVHKHVLGACVYNWIYTRIIRMRTHVLTSTYTRL